MAAALPASSGSFSRIGESLDSIWDPPLALSDISALSANLITIIFKNYETLTFSLKISGYRVTDASGINAAKLDMESRITQLEAFTPAMKLEHLKVLFVLSRVHFIHFFGKLEEVQGGMKKFELSSYKVLKDNLENYLYPKSAQESIKEFFLGEGAGIGRELLQHNDSELWLNYYSCFTVSSSYQFDYPIKFKDLGKNSSNRPKSYETEILLINNRYVGLLDTLETGKMTISIEYKIGVMGISLHLKLGKVLEAFPSSISLQDSLADDNCFLITRINIKKDVSGKYCFINRAKISVSSRNICISTFVEDLGSTNVLLELGVRPHLELTEKLAENGWGKHFALFLNKGVCNEINSDTVTPLHHLFKSRHWKWNRSNQISLTHFLEAGPNPFATDRDGLTAKGVVKSIADSERKRLPYKEFLDTEKAIEPFIQQLTDYEVDFKSKIKPACNHCIQIPGLSKIIVEYATDGI